MKTSIRFENAVSKLYNAFHENRLNAFDCSACAVGNMCDNNENWSEYFGNAVSLTPDQYITSVYPYPEVKNQYNYNGYNQDELFEVEKIFLNVWIGQNHDSGTCKELQFKGLCAVIKYLCELEGIDNIMDYTCLFTTVEDKAVVELSSVFALDAL